MKHLLQNHLRLLILIGASILLNACGSSEPICFGTVHVNMPNTPKVILTATDTNGKKLSAYEISYKVKSNSATYGHSGSKTISCNSIDECDLQFFGVGDLDITVTKTGYASATTQASIQAIGACGESNAEKLTVILKPLI